MAKRIKIGDVVEVPTSKGLAYAQVTHIHNEEHSSYGPLVRIVPGFFTKRPERFDAVRAQEHERGHRIELLSDRAAAILVDEGLPRNGRESRSPLAYEDGGFTTEEDPVHRKAGSQVIDRPQHGGNSSQHRRITRDNHQ